nr:type II secretion system protein GspG [Wenzhouxiangella limi]
MSQIAEKQVEFNRLEIARNHVEALDTAVNMFFVDMFRRPDELLELVEGTGNNWNGPYIDRVALTDPWGNPFQYVNAGQRAEWFDIYSFGPPGTQAPESEHIGNWSQ